MIGFELVSEALDFKLQIWKKGDYYVLTDKNGVLSKGSKEKIFEDYQFYYDEKREAYKY